MNEAIKKVESEPCKCVWCVDCHGSGQLSPRMRSHPEDFDDPCDNCCGAGIVEMCDRCQLLQEMDHMEMTDQKMDIVKEII